MNRKLTFKERLTGKSQVIPEATPTFYSLDFVQQFISSSMGVTDQKLLKYYLSVPELSSVINYRAKVFASMRVKLEDYNGKEIEKHEVLDLLNQPNPLQDFREFAMQASVLKDIFGNSFIHRLFGINKTVALWNLPPADSRIIPTSDTVVLFNQRDVDNIIKAYEFKYNSQWLRYEPSEIIHFNDSQVRFDLTVSKMLKGTSRIQPLTQVCENIITAYEARGIIQGNAPLGILSNETKDGMGSITMDPGEKEAVQDDLKKYGLSKEKYQFIVTNATLRFVAMTANMNNLKLFEEVGDGQGAIAEAFSFPVEIFQNNVTYENKKEAKKMLYQDSTIPDATNWLSMLSKGLSLDKQRLILKPDFSHVAVLQDDLEKKSRMWNTATMALNRALQDGVITIEEYKDNLAKIGMI